MNTRPSLVLVCGWACLSAVVQAGTVSIVPSSSTVAQGGSVIFSVTAEPAAYVQQVVVTYQGESVQDVSTTVPFSTAHTFNTPADGLVVTATATYSNGEPEAQSTATVDVVGITLLGPDAPLRGWPTSYKVQSNPIGKPLNDINWTYVWAGGLNSSQGNSVWSGMMVLSGVLTVRVTVSGFMLETSKNISVVPRNWSTAISCVQDSDPDYGDIPTYYAELGCNRDIRSHYSSYLFVPRNGPTDFSPSFTLAEVRSGPCAGRWYVASSTLRCERETAINRYIKADGPVLGNANFYGANANCFSSSPAHFVQAVKNHEYRGTPDTPQSLGGHQGRIENAVIGYGYDPKRWIEPLVAENQYVLRLIANDTISNCESDIIFFVANELYMITYGPNWGSGDALGTGQHSVWDDLFMMWTDCLYGPDSF